MNEAVTADQFDYSWATVKLLDFCRAPVFVGILGLLHDAFLVSTQQD